MKCLVAGIACRSGIVTTLALLRNGPRDREGGRRD